MSTFNVEAGDKLYIQDVTLRDGMHAVRHMYGIDHVRAIAAAIEASGVDAIEVAHGDGLSGASFNYGFGAHTDWEWLEAVAEVLDKCVLTTLILPGVGTVEELRRAYDIGVRSVRVATHCTEADVSRQHIGIARKIDADAAYHRQTVDIVIGDDFVIKPARLDEGDIALRGQPDPLDPRRVLPRDARQPHRGL